MASATPSVSSYYLAQQGEYKLFEMHRRYNENAMPKARIVDMRSELFDYHNMSSVSIRLQDEIRRNLEKGKNHPVSGTGAATTPLFPAGNAAMLTECQNCKVALTYHRSSNQLVCHYCGYSQANVTQCRNAGQSM